MRSVRRDAHIVPPYSDSSFAVATHERQRRKKKVDASHETKATESCERAVKGIRVKWDIARADS